MSSIKGGDEVAFLEVYDRYASRVLGLLVRILGDRTESEDVLQEVMLEIWRKADRYDPSLGTPATWILLVARSRAIDRIRSRARERQRLETLRETYAEAASAPTGGGDTAGALEALHPEQRTPIVLAFLHGLSRDQIAEVMDIPVGTVKTRIRSGVHRLRESLVETRAAS